MQWQLLGSTARVTSTSGDTGTAVAVGIREGFLYYLTANHVVDNIGNREIEWFSKSTYADWAKQQRPVIGSVDVADRISRCDLAVLRIPLPKNDPNPPIVDWAQPGERPRQFPFKALSIGCTNGLSPVCRIEDIGAKKLVKRTNEFFSFFWESALPTKPGQSGGPLFSAKGKLIGICAASQDKNGYFIHLDEIHAWLKQDGFGWFWETKKPAR
jgi:S1-C subfamily serine protease